MPSRVNYKPVRARFASISNLLIPGSVPGYPNRRMHCPFPTTIIAQFQDIGSDGQNILAQPLVAKR